MTIDKKDHTCGKIVDYCICGSTRILFCVYCKEVVGYQKKDEDVRISISIISSLMADKKQEEYDDKLLEDLR